MNGKQLIRSLPAKIAAYFLLVISTCLVVSCIIGAVYVIEADYYAKSENQILKENIYNLARSDGRTALLAALGLDQPYTADDRETNFRYEIFDADGKRLSGNYEKFQTGLSFDFTYDQDALTDGYTVKAYINDQFPVSDRYAAIHQLVSISYALRYSIYVLGILSLALAVICFIFLMCSAGHKAGHDEIVRDSFVRMPFDLLTGLLLLAVYAAGRVFYDNVLYSLSDPAVVILLVVGSILGIVLATAYCMNFAVRVKLGDWWKNTLIYRLLVFLLRVCKALGRGLGAFVRNMPLIWKSALLLVVLSGLELIVFAAFYWDVSWLLMAWVLEKALIIPAVLYLAFVLKKLQKGGEALAAGDLAYQVNTGRMFWEFRRHGENLNNIAEGMARAVDERMKSERFKTELITNVSHDIKTPLTSIINYADLIGREQTDNEKITEYTAVLLRQSERLKKLIENLVEASKASTGSIDVLVSPCEVGVLLAQTVGEYEQRLQDGGLELITKQPEAPVKIMADGRLLWRVFDNLMNNICKYGQSGTRVYLSIELKDGEAVISFKNTSKYPLDIPADELMERFVRGDGSRGTEGNGLGLAIAQNLTELQKGRLDLTVDGDLFKVTLRFKTIS